jgi:hypothetical protein
MGVLSAIVKSLKSRSCPDVASGIGGLRILLLFFFLIYWQGKKDSNLRMLESKSSALTNLAIPLRDSVFAVAFSLTHFR